MSATAEPARPVHRDYYGRYQRAGTNDRPVGGVTDGSNDGDACSCQVIFKPLVPLVVDSRPEVGSVPAWACGAGVTPMVAARSAR